MKRTRPFENRLATPRYFSQPEAIQPFSKLALLPTEAGEQWAGAGFLLGGLVIGAAVTVQLLAGDGTSLPNVVYRAFHILAPVSLVAVAAGGFALSRTRLGRWVSSIMVGMVAIQAGWGRFLPSISWTAPRLVLAGVLILAGIKLIRVQDHTGR